MFELRQVYCFADPLFYEDVSRWSSGAGRLPDGELSVSGFDPPPGWTRRERGVWTSLRPDEYDSPDQGWKIHVSATLDNADRLCQTVWDYCTARGIPFKHLRNRNVLLALSAKYAPRGASGKMLTVYPRDEAELHRVLEELSSRTEGEEGPYILSDLRWGAGPLYVRYGGFKRMTCTEASGDTVAAIRRPDGELVPDRRTPVFSPPAWVDIPDFLLPHLEARRRSGGDQPYRVDKTLHFSNAGGVYLATRLTDGERVVLKEARPHAGVDENHQDSVARMQHERWALERLSGITGVPELHDHFVLGGHHFLAEEFVEGQSLHVWRGCNHPWVTSSHPTEQQIAEFTGRALAVCDNIEKLLGEIHARGVVFGDLHLGNVMVAPDDTVSLIDFELAFDAERKDWRPGLRATGFADRGRTGTELDLHALAALRLGVFMNLNRVLAFERSKARQFVEVIQDHFPVPEQWGRQILDTLDPPALPAEHPPLSFVTDPVPASTDWAAVGGSVRDAVRASATPERADRLFPGDIEQFRTGALGIAYGAAGVLWALSVAGHGRDARHEEWLLERADEEADIPAGFYDGAAGIAYVLEHLGHADAAAGVLERSCHKQGAGAMGPNLFSGTTGVALTLLGFAESTGDSAYLDQAVLLGGELADAVDAGRMGRYRSGANGEEKVEAGLMRGWSGVALGLTRLYEATRDAGYLDLAVRALHLDLDRCVRTGDGSLQVEESGVRTLGYLDVGSAGIAVVADEVLQHTDDERLARDLPALARACAREFAIQAGLFRGRAGLLAAVARLGARSGLTEPDSVVSGHLERLSWHAVPFQRHIAFPGSLNFRLSMDLATGGAGVLLAMATATRPGAPFLPFFTPRA